MGEWILINTELILNLLAKDALAFLNAEPINVIKVFTVGLVGEEKLLLNIMNLILELTKFGKVCVNVVKILKIVILNIMVVEE
jgi:hypothetical protein